MPSCSLIQCAARKSEKHPNLSFHRFPKNDSLRAKWFDAIGGTANLNHRHAKYFLCSLHFEESQCNRTLDVIRLRDNTVPTIFNENSTPTPMPNTTKDNSKSAHEMEHILSKPAYICEEIQKVGQRGDYWAFPLTYERRPVSSSGTYTGWNRTRDFPANRELPSTSENETDFETVFLEENDTEMYQSEEILTPTKKQPTTKPVQAAHKTGDVQEKVCVKNQAREILRQALELPALRPSTSKDIAVLYEISNIRDPTQGTVYVSKEVLAPQHKPECPPSSACNRERQKLRKLHTQQRRKVKTLQEKIRRQGKKIGKLEALVKELKQKLNIDTEESNECYLLIV